MFPSRLLIGVMIPVAAFFVAGCASTPSGQVAARECKIVAADFVNKPTKNPTPAEQAEAEMQMSRLAASRGGYRAGTNLISDAARDCY